MKISDEFLMAEAVKKTGLSDWGDEEGFREPLRMLIRSFREDEPRGRNLMPQFCGVIVDILSKRLLIQKIFRSHPEVGNIPVKRPLFITGLARTGTTLLHNLLNLDALTRTLLYWELADPVQSSVGPGGSSDALIKAVERELINAYSGNPEILKVHEIKADGPEECKYLMFLTFMTTAFYPSFRVLGYLEWLFHQDLTHAYKYYRKLLQLFLWRKHGEPMVLKCPFHLPYLDWVFKVFPDANVVWLHRDPCEAIPSSLSLVKTFFPPTDIDMDEITALTCKYSADSVNRGLKIRDNRNSQGFLDVGYRELLDDPIKVVRRIYEKFNYDFTPQLEVDMKEWLRENPQNKHGIHKYSLEQFGLKQEVIKEALRDYYQGFSGLMAAKENN